MRYPEFLKENGTIGFVSPSFGCATEPYKSAFVAALDKFHELGYETKVGPNNEKTDGVGISTKPRDCAKEFTNYYVSSETDVLISNGGGELMCTILPYVDFELLKKAEPKWFMGYSDNTNLVFLLATLMDTAAIYGPCSSTFGMTNWHPSLKDSFGMLEGKVLSVHNYDKYEIEEIKDEEHPFEGFNTTEAFKLVKNTEEDVTVSGRLLGGCMDCLNNLVGTKFDKVKEFNEKYGEDGIIWVLESCDLSPMDIRRAMWHMYNAGWFEKASGFLIGRPARFGEEMMGVDQYNAILDTVGEMGVPVIMDLDIGHMPPMMPLIIGAKALVSTKANSITIDMILE